MNMKINHLKAWLPVLKLVVIVIALIFVIIAVYSIPSRLDAQAKAEADYIENYKAELKAEQNKD